MQYTYRARSPFVAESLRTAILQQQPHSVICDDSSEVESCVEITPAIALRAVCKTFGSHVAVDHLTLTVQPGEIFGLLGPNGSGKTTTMNLISGLSRPSGGEIQILGYNVPRAIREVRQILGVVPQETALYEELTAWDNLDFHADLFGVPRKEKKQRIMAMLNLVGLSRRKDSLVKTFSGGMKRRLAIARALLHDPQLIYLDEPTLGVDVQSRRAIWDYILALRAQGKTVLITTNYLEEAQALCDRIAILDHGTLIVVDTPEQLQQQYGGGVLELEMACPYPSTAPLQALPGVQEVTQESNHLTIHLHESRNTMPLVLAQVALEGEITDMVVRERSLDEIFLQLTGSTLRD